MKRTGLLIICVAVAFSLLLGTAIAKERVIIYTSLENEEVVDYLELAKKEFRQLDCQQVNLVQGCWLKKTIPKQTVFGAGP